MLLLVLVLLVLLLGQAGWTCCCICPPSSSGSNHHLFGWGDVLGAFANHPPQPSKVLLAQHVSAGQHHVGRRYIVVETDGTAADLGKNDGGPVGAPVLWDPAAVGVGVLVVWVHFRANGTSKGAAAAPGCWVPPTPPRPPCSGGPARCGEAPPRGGIHQGGGRTATAGRVRPSVYVVVVVEPDVQKIADKGGKIKVLQCGWNPALLRRRRRRVRRLTPCGCRCCCHRCRCPRGLRSRCRRGP